MYGISQSGTARERGWWRTCMAPAMSCSVSEAPIDTAKAATSSRFSAAAESISQPNRPANQNMSAYCSRVRKVSHLDAPYIS